MKIFTLTPGRSGSHWLATFLRENSGMPTLHEPLEIGDFGVHMPDIKTMRAFNTYGNHDFVRAFWSSKLDFVHAQSFYVETNHTLAKCGLIENLATSPARKSASIVVLRRDLAKQCASYIRRHDFSNITLMWQWYLQPNYPLNLVPFEPFAQLGAIAIPLWYSFEMEVRQAYYLRKFSGSVNFIEADLEKVTKPEGATELWNALGGTGTAVIPAASNVSRSVEDDFEDQAREAIRHFNFSPADLANEIIRSGFDFGERA